MIYFGNTELLGLKIGNTDISAVYAGDLLIWPTSVTAWSVTPSQIEMAASGGSENIKIASLSSWTISSSENWVTFSQASGDSGRTTVVATIAAHTDSSARTATITATDGTNVSTIAVTQSKYVSGLPSNTFVFNFNAKDYNASTRTIPRTSGQSLTQDMVMKKTSNSSYANVSSAITASTDHISFSAGTYAQFAFTSSALSPFNITTSSPNLTFIVKWWRNPDAGSSIWGNSPQSEVLANRGNSPGNINWIARITPTIAHLITSSNNTTSPYSVTWSANPVVMMYRISNRTVEIKNITENLSNTPFSSTWNGGTNRITFFGQGYQSTATDVRNCVGGDFYWAYLSREVLTDEEVQQVIDYNDNK